MKNNLASNLRTAALAAALLVLPALAFATDPAPADQPAVAIAKVAPKYPSDNDRISITGRHSGTEGNVVVSFVISDEGEVWNAAVVSSTNSRLEPAALAAIKQWTFTPAVKNGHVTAIRATQEFEFTVAEQPADNRMVAALGKH